MTPELVTVPLSALRMMPRRPPAMGPELDTVAVLVSMPNWPEVIVPELVKVEFIYPKSSFGFQAAFRRVSCEVFNPTNHARAY